MTLRRRRIVTQRTEAPYSVPGIASRPRQLELNLQRVLNDNTFALPLLGPGQRMQKTAALQNRIWWGTLGGSGSPVKTRPL